MTKAKYVYDVSGDRLLLTEIDLREDHASQDHGVNYFDYQALFFDINDAYTQGYSEITIYGLTAVHRISVRFEPENGRIGCRKFSPPEFRKILRAAGVKIKATRKPRVARKTRKTRKAQA